MPTKKQTTESAEVTKPSAPKGKYTYACGKRKTSIARVKIYKGTGTITVNGKTASEYFTVKTLIGLIKAPFKLTGNDKKFDTVIEAKGGGVCSQAEAVRHGITKCLILSDPLLKPTLKKAGFLTRDARIKERKKYGLKRARKGPQFSKR
jgi:small subunit ribosomal protein S9